MSVIELFEDSNHPVLDAVIAHSYLLIIALFTAGPYLIMVSISLMEGWAPVVPPKLVPDSPTLANYVTVWRGDTWLLPQPFRRFMMNTLIVAFGATIIVVVVDTIAGYAFARLHFRGRDLTFAIVLATLMISPLVLFVPVYLLFDRLGLINSYLGIIIPHTVSAFGVFLMRQFIKTLPRSLEDAALIDGCSRFGVFIRVVVPLIIPALVTLAIITFIITWNSFLWPLVIGRNPEYYTLTVALGFFQGQVETQWANLMAATAITMVPIVVVFVSLQRYYVRGFMIGGMKGT